MCGLAVFEEYRSHESASSLADYWKALPRPKSILVVAHVPQLPGLGTKFHRGAYIFLMPDQARTEAGGDKVVVCAMSVSEVR